MAITEVKPKNTRFQQTTNEFTFDGCDIFMNNLANTTGRGITIYADLRMKAHKVKPRSGL